MSVRAAGSALLLAVLIGSVTACGARTVDSSATSAQVDVVAEAALHDGLPQAVRDRGQLIMGTDASYPPIEFTADGGKTLQGFDIDLARALAAKLGLTLTIRNAQFDGILAGINSGRFDFSMSGLTDNRDREQRNTFVTYFSAGTAIGVKKGNPQRINGPDDLCGRRVAVEKGTTQVDSLTTDRTDTGSLTLRGRCLSQGHAAPTPVALPDQSTVNQALIGGRVDAFLSDSPILDYQATLVDGAIEQGGTTAEAAPWGIAFPKDSPLAPSFQRALTALIRDGKYTRIVETWGLQKGAVTEAGIDAAVS
jgi:polar amino acid transport system substrate-binding protein